MVCGLQQPVRRRSDLIRLGHLTVQLSLVPHRPVLISWFPALLIVLCGLPHDDEVLTVQTYSSTTECTLKSLLLRQVFRHVLYN